MTEVPSIAPRAIAMAAVALAVLLVMVRPLELTMPVYGELAEQLRAGRIDSSFEPLGYPWLIAAMPWASLETSAKALHLICFAALALVVLAISRRTDQPQSLWPFVAVFWILFNPYLLVNLFRLNDNNVNVVAMLAIFGLVTFGTGTTRYSAWSVAGALLGALAMVRPNVLSVLPAIWIAAYVPRTLRFPAKHGLLATASAAVAYVVFSLVITGGPAFRPSNGPYNLFAGNNPAAASAVRQQYNAESSLPAGLAWCGVAEPPRAVAAETYVRCAMRFASSAPLDALETTLFKWYNLMWRPNLRLADSPAEIALQVAQLLPSWLWWGATILVLLRQRRILDPTATGFVMLFAAPFILTNADPRFRLPLDAVFALSLSSPASRGLVRAALGSPASP